MLSVRCFVILDHLSNAQKGIKKPNVGLLLRRVYAQITDGKEREAATERCFDRFFF